MNYAPLYGGLDYADYDRQTVDLTLPETGAGGGHLQNLGDLPMITFSYEMIEGAGEIMQGQRPVGHPPCFVWKASWTPPGVPQQV